MENASKIAVNLLGTDGNAAEVLVGNAFHILDDKTNGTFQTSSIKSFIEFLKGGPSLKEIAIYYNEQNLTAEKIAIDRYSIPIASCSMGASPELKLLVASHERNLAPSEMENLLLAVRPFICTAGQKLLQNIKHIVVQKVSKVDMSTDNSGNAAFSFSMESAEKEQMEMPNELVFTIPVFDDCEDTIALSFEPRFFFEVQGAAPKMSFRYSNPRLNVIIRDKRKEIIQTHISGIECHKFWGSMNITKQDDSWQYKQNEAKIS